MGEILGKSKLDSLRTIIKYDNFGKYPDNCATYPDITEEQHLLDGTFWKKNISDKLLNAVCYVYIRKDTKSIDDNLCNYLYYWLGSKVLTNLRLKDFFFDVIRTIYHILNKGELGKICNRVNYRIHEDNFHKFKLVYDLSEDFETYNSHLLKFNPSCDMDYEDAIKSYKLLYKKLRNECTIERTNYYDHYCDVFNKYFTQDKNDEISSWTCKLRETDKQDQQLEKEPREEAPKKHIQEELTAGRVRIQEDSVQTAQHSRSIVPYLNKELFDGESFSSASENSSPSTIKKSITSAVSAAGVLVPPFLIYNYEPARSWINKLLRMNKGTNRNPYANQELMADFSMPEDFYSERNRYNIMYNPE